MRAYRSVTTEFAKQENAPSLSITTVSFKSNECTLHNSIVFPISVPKHYDYGYGRADQLLCLCFVLLLPH